MADPCTSSAGSCAWPAAIAAGSYPTCPTGRRLERCLWTWSVVRRPALGFEFLEQVDAILLRIQRTPGSFDFARIPSELLTCSASRSVYSTSTTNIFRGGSSAPTSTPAAAAVPCAGSKLPASSTLSRDSVRPTRQGCMGVDECFLNGFNLDQVASESKGHGTSVDTVDGIKRHAERTFVHPVSR